MTRHLSVATTLHPTVRDARKADHAAARAALFAAYRPYSTVVPPALYTTYLADVLDVSRHAAQGGRLMVAETAGAVVGVAAFYPSAAPLGIGLPAHWASGRAMGVRPDARGLGVARALLGAIEERAVAAGAPVFAFHTAGFMTGAVRLYEHLGYRRAPEFDVDMAAHYGVAGLDPVPAIAYRRDLLTSTLREAG